MKKLSLILLIYGSLLANSTPTSTKKELVKTTVLPSKILLKAYSKKCFICKNMLEKCKIKDSKIKTIVSNCHVKAKKNASKYNTKVPKAR